MRLPHHPQVELHENMKEAEQRQRDRLSKVEASMKTYVATAIEDALNSFEIPVPRKEE